MGIELLAPVGSFEAFKSAIDNGANAIYLAGTRFGAREKATFTNEEIIKMIKEAHINEIKVYVTVNTLIYDDEIEDVLSFVDFLYNNDCDAIIVQDIGLITLIKNIYPDLVIHASTQMNTMTLKQAQLLKNMGVERIVVARETNISLIKKIIEEVKIEVEVFIHGALCVSYSGQCLFSSSVSKKSGNRGECLQLCRLPYSLYRENEKIIDNEYLLSMKDLNTVNKINELVEANVASLKIEGRLKSGSYVGLVTRVYRKYLDKFNNEGKIDVDKDDYKNLEKVFNRKFTEGYLFGEQNKNITNTFRPNNLGVRIGKIVEVRNNKVYIKLEDELNQGDGIRIVGKEDVGFYANMIEVKKLLTNKANKGDIACLNVKGKVNVNDIVYKTSDCKLNEEILNNSIRKKFPIRVNVEAYIDNELKIEFVDNLGNKVVDVSNYKVVRAINSPTTKEKIEKQLSKLNDTIYYIESLKINCDEMILIPVSIINECRRNLVDKLNDIRSKCNKRKGKQKLQLKTIKIDNDSFSLKIKPNNDEQYNLSKEYVEDKDIYYNAKGNIFCYPRISENKIKTNNDKILLNELHDVDNKKEMIANCYLNCTNIFALYTLYSFGFKRVTLSLEMSKKRIVDLISNYKKYFKEQPNVEVIVYSKTDLLVSKYCLINKCLNKERIGCKECEKNNYYLEDRKGYKIPIVRDFYCNTKLLNPRALMLIEYTEYLKNNGINCVRIEFNDESVEECRNILDFYYGKEVLLDSRKFTYGYFKDGDEE